MEGREKETETERRKESEEGWRKEIEKKRWKKSLRLLNAGYFM